MSYTLDSEITLARALEEVKYLDTEIQRLISTFVPVSQKKSIVSHVAPSDPVNRAESAYKEITDMIALRNLLKQNIIRQNSTTEVNMYLNDTKVSMPLAVLIESQLNIKPPVPKKYRQSRTSTRRGGKSGFVTARSSAVPMADSAPLTFEETESYEERLIKTLHHQYEVASQNVENKNLEVQRQLDKLLEAGSTATKDTKTIDALDMDKKIESYRRNNTWVIRDPLNAEELCSQLEEEIEDFASQQNSHLTISNSNTCVPTRTSVKVPEFKSEGETIMLVAVALDELNRLHDRIMKKIYSLKAVTSHRSSDVQTDEFSTRAKSNYQSIRDLITRRKLIRHALVQSNATTLVKVAGDKMTVAEAMEKKSRGIALDRYLLQQMEKTQASVRKNIDTQNAVLERRCEAKLKERLQDWTEDEKLALNREDEMTKLRRKDVLELVDPINIYDKITAYRSKLTTFDREINHAITESNSRTCINF